METNRRRIQTHFGSRFEEYSLLVALVVLVGILSLLPLARLLYEALAPGGRFSLEPLQQMMASGTTWTAARHSLATALGGTLLATLIGGAVALVVSLTDEIGRASCRERV